MVTPVTDVRPAVSVVVATHNRRPMLERLVRALENQNGAPAFELIVVDDASTDDTLAWLEEAATRSPVALRAIAVTPNRGPAHARNLGWRAARADVVCFTDDDCVPTPDWLANLVAPIGSADIVQGRTQPIPEQANREGPFSRTMWVVHEEGFYETCNIAYRRSLLEDLGGFEETFRFPFGEDTDLAWRAKQRGASTFFAADALTHHEVWPSDVRAAFRNAKRLDGIVQMTAKHPDLRRHAKWGIFARRAHPWAIAALSGAVLLAAAPRHPGAWAVAIGLAANYAWWCRQYRARPPKVWHWIGVVPTALVLDVYEVGVMARSSLRWRTLVL